MMLKSRAPIISARYQNETKLDIVYKEARYVVPVASCVCLCEINQS